MDLLNCGARFVTSSTAPHAVQDGIAVLFQIRGDLHRFFRFNVVDADGVAQNGFWGVACPEFCSRNLRNMFTLLDQEAIAAVVELRAIWGLKQCARAGIKHVSKLFPMVIFQRAIPRHASGQDSLRKA